MAVRPIDANALSEEAYTLWRYGTPDIKYRMEVLKGMIDSTPTIDYSPVIHASWIMRDDGEGLRIVCSRCGKEPKEETPFCAHCGAMMDGGKNDGCL